MNTPDQESQTFKIIPVEEAHWSLHPAAAAASVRTETLKVRRQLFSFHIHLSSLNVTIVGDNHSLRVDSYCKVLIKVVKLFFSESNKNIHNAWF